MSTAEWQQRMETAVTKHEAAIYGDNERRGLNARVDAIEEKVKSERRNTVLLAFVAIGMVADLIVNLIT